MAVVRRRVVRVILKRMSAGLIFLVAMIGGLGLGFLAVRLLSDLTG